jgi:hypothetical protein
MIDETSGTTSSSRDPSILGFDPSTKSHVAAVDSRFSPSGITRRDRARLFTRREGTGGHRLAFNESYERKVLSMQVGLRVREVGRGFRLGMPLVFVELSPLARDR